MATDQLFPEVMPGDEVGSGNLSSMDEWNSCSDHNLSGDFECNICLDPVQDPVVTFCGHLFCWPCIYKWLHVNSITTGTHADQPRQCPVCKAEISETMLIPLYGRDRTTNSCKSKASHLDIAIPRRPSGPAYKTDTRSASSVFGPHSSQHDLNYHDYAQPELYHPHLRTYTDSPTYNPVGNGRMTNAFDPVIGVFGELIYAMMFGNNLTNFYNYSESYHPEGSRSPRIRRRMMKADESLSRVSFFLFCCVLMCLVTF